MNSNQALQLAKEALDKALQEKKMSQEMVRSLGPAILDALKPSIEQMASNALLSREELLKAIGGIKINVPKADVPEAKVTVSIPEIKVPQPIVNVTVPDIKLPEFKEIKLPVIKVPKPEVTINPTFKIPDIKMPDEMDVKGWVGMMGYDKGFLTNPLPVQLRDSKGNPVNLLENLTQVMSGGNSARIVKVSGILSTVGVVTIDPDGNPTYSSGSSGLTDTELRASSVPVAQVSGAVWSVNVAQQDISQLMHQVSGATWSVSVNDIFRSTVASSLINADDRLRVSVETGGSGLTDAELRATAVPIAQVSGASWSVSAAVTFDQAQNQGEADDRTLRVVHAGDVGLSTSALATSPDVVSLAIIDDWDESDRAKVNVIVGQAGIAAGQGDTDVRTLRIVQAGDSISSVSVTNTVTVDGSGVTQPVSATNLDIRDLVNASDSVSIYQISGANWSVSVTNSVTSTISVGPTPADTADDGNAPIQVGGVARTANPTAVAANDVVKATFDDVGRQVVRTVNVRDLMQTAYATLSSGTETTLLAGAASTFHDLVYIMGANTSDAAVQVDIRSATAAGVVMTIEIPPEGTSGVAPPVPIPQDVAAAAWTADMADITGTTVLLSALFSKEI